MNQEDKETFLKPSIERKKTFIKRHKILTGLGIIIIGVLIFTIFSSSKKDEANSARLKIAEQRVAQKEAELAKQKEVKMLWDIPALMGKSNYEIANILGVPTVWEILSADKIERFKLVNNKMTSFFKEDLLAHGGMKPTVFVAHYKQSDCGMMVCGNDLSFSYTDPNKPIKYFFIDNYPVENPALSVDELKKIGNLTGNTTFKVLPAVMVDGKSVFGIDICDKNFKGDAHIPDSEVCSN